MGMGFYFPIPGFFLIIQFLSDLERPLHKPVQEETAVSEATEVHWAGQLHLSVSVS